MKNFKDIKLAYMLMSYNKELVENAETNYRKSKTEFQDLLNKLNESDFIRIGNELGYLDK